MSDRPTYSYSAERLRATPSADAQLGAIPTARSTSGVEVPSIAYQEAQAHWAVIETIKAGTSAVRSQGEAFLPLEPFENDKAYKRRCDRSTLSPWYTRLVRGLVGMVLRKPIALQNAAKEITAQLDNINLLGDDLNSFAREVFESAIDYGYTGILVDYPRSNAVLLNEEKENGDRPYWIHYSAPDIIGWRYSIAQGRRIFTQLRIKCTELEPDGDFGEKLVDRIKVYDLTEMGVRWRLFQEVDDAWKTVDEGMISLPYIPFAFVSTDKGRSSKTPPMLEVAHLNVKHFQLSSDLDHALHLCAMPKLVLFGYDTENGDIAMGADEAIVFQDPTGKAEWISPDVGTFEPLASRIGEIEAQMAVLGLSTLVSQKNVGESAEAKKLDRTQGDSIMAVIAQGLQDAFDLCLEYHAAYLKVTAPTCQINRDFDVAQLTPQAIDTFSKLQQAGQISPETLLMLLKKGEVFDDEFSIEEELARLQSEMQARSAVSTVSSLSTAGLLDSNQSGQLLQRFGALPADVQLFNPNEPLNP